MSEPAADDAELVEALAGGNSEAARELYRRHCHPILRFAVAMTDNRAIAEDIVHDTFVELLHRPGNFDPARGSLRGFLYGIARHRIAKSLRVASVVHAGLASEDEVQPGPAACSSPAVTPEEHAERAQYVERLRAAIMALPLAYREVIVWCDLEEVPYAMAAEILDCPIGTVRSRLHRARGLLAAAFQRLRHEDAESCESESDTGDSPVPSCSSIDRALGGGSA